MCRGTVYLFNLIIKNSRVKFFEINIKVNNFKISEIETPFGKRILIKKRKIKEQMKIILLVQYFEIFQISSSGKIFTKT